MKQEMFNLMNEFEVYMEMEDTDKEKIPKLTQWVLDMFKMTILERAKKEIFPKRGEVWTCNLGENIGSEVNKLRPCLVVQNDKGNEHAPTTIVVPISHKTPRQPTHLSLQGAEFVFKSGTMDGVVMGEQVRIISKARLVKKLGKLHSGEMSKIDGILKVALGIQ